MNNTNDDKKPKDIVEQSVEAVENATEQVVDTAHNAAVKTEKKLLHLASEFLKLEAAGGIILAIAALAALIVANSPLQGTYNYIFNEIDFRIGFSDIGSSFDMELKKPLILWINDGLMAVFFFLVGLEIKREIMHGELSSRDKALLPIFGALGGIALPAAIFWMLNNGSPENMQGWAIPAATDIAFALGVISLLGSRVPISLKILLTAIAIIDDIGAILIIAVFYSHGIQIVPLYFAMAALVGLFILNRRNITATAPYILLTIILWIAVLESGIHATLAGVVAALFIPLACKKDAKKTPLVTLEHGLHPWAAYGVLPIFAFANAGVSFQGISTDIFIHPVTLGIFLGLIFGKQIGVFSMIAFAHITGIARKPEGTSWLQIYAVSILCGVGFTMSLFIGGLAYQGTEMQVIVRSGVLTASIVASIAGYLILRLCTKKQMTKKEG